MYGDIYTEKCWHIPLNEIGQSILLAAAIAKRKREFSTGDFGGSGKGIQDFASPTVPVSLLYTIPASHSDFHINILNYSRFQRFHFEKIDIKFPSLLM